MSDPLVEKGAIVAFHHLKAPEEIGIDPTRHVAQSIRRQPTHVAETPVHGNCITISKVFNNHVKHRTNHLCFLDESLNLPTSPAGLNHIPCALMARGLSL